MAISKFVLPSRLAEVKESATLRLNAQVKAMQAAGQDVINLTAGEPDAAVPEIIQEAAIAAVRSGKSKYTAVAGIPELRALIAQRYAGTTADQILVTNGAKQAIYQALMALVSPGQEVIIPAPFWLSYPDMVRLADGVPAIVPTTVEGSYKLTVEQLTHALSEHSRVLILNSPNNPTGSVYSQEELRALGEVLLRHPHGKNVWVISDEIYESLVYSPSVACSFAVACPELRDRTVIASGFSKSVALTGWRVGWSVAPKALASTLATLQGQISSSINSVAQWASLAAFELGEEYFAQSRESYRIRRDTVSAAFQKLLKSRTIKAVLPQGAFYFWFEVDALLKKRELRERGVKDATDLAELILSQAHVAVVPGEPFGGSSSLRLSYATDLATLRKGCERLTGFLESL